MKVKLCCFFVCLLFSNLFAEVVSWKGMEMGTEQNPKWLKDLVEKNNEKCVRQHFEIENDYLIILGIGESLDLNYAMSLAYADCLNKIPENQRQNPKNFSQVYEFWIKDDKKGFCVYNIMKLQR